MRSPFEEAQAVYDSEPCRRGFFEDLLSHLAYGFVFSSPKAFLMGRPVRHDASPEEILNPDVGFSNPTAWLVYCAAGKSALDVLVEFEPYPLPFIGWERNNVLRFHRSERLRHVLRISRSYRFLQGRKRPQAATAAETSNPIHGSRERVPPTAS
jgi:hypothetical protein